MRREIEDRVVVDHEDDWMPRRLGAAVRDMRVHDGRAGDRPTVEQPVSRLGVRERAELSRQALVGGPGDRRHDAHLCSAASSVAYRCCSPPWAFPPKLGPPSGAASFLVRLRGWDCADEAKPAPKRKNFPRMTLGGARQFSQASKGPHLYS